MKKNHRRITAAVLSLSLGFTAAAPVMAPLATAQITADQSSSVDLEADVSLTINKREGDPVPGADPSDAPGTPLAGVGFRIEKVTLTNTLGTTAGWEEVSTLDAGDTDLPTTEIGTFTTGAGGSINISTDTNPDFTVGVYRVTEIQSGNYSTAAPFLVTLPFTDSDTGVWEYNQVVAPKNQQLSVSKGVSDAGATLGSTIDYTINASVPAGDLNQFAIVDPLPTELTLAEDAPVTISAENVTFNPDDYTVERTGQTLTVTFNESGREALQTARTTDPALAAVVEFSPTITGIPTNGIIRNDVTLQLPNGGVITTMPDPETPDAPDNGAETRLGQLTINKTDASGAPIAIDDEVTRGATFELWRCQGSESSLNVVGAPLEAALDDSGATPIPTTFTTGADGSITLPAVQVMDWVNGQATVDGEADQLCVVETIAPNGYALNPEPQVVTYDTSTVEDAYDMVVTVENLEDSIIGQLPSTGGKGTLAIIAAGLLVAAAGAIAALRGNRARK